MKILLDNVGGKKGLFDVSNTPAEFWFCRGILMYIFIPVIVVYIIVLNDYRS